MRTIASLFGKSPFSPLQTHMDKVGSCIEKLSEIFHIFSKQDLKEIEKLSVQLCRLEHEADLTKNDIRNHLPKSLFLAIDRSHFLDILSIQDSIADKAEDIGILFTLRPIELYHHLDTELTAFYKKSTEVFWAARKIISEIDELLESSFGGIEAEKVKAMVEEIAKLESTVDIMQQTLMKKLFSDTGTLSNSGFYLWLKLIEEVGSIAGLSERLANRIRMVLELK